MAKTSVVVRHFYDGAQAEISDANGLDCSVEPSLTKQSFADECDINNIMRRYERDGVIDHVKQYGGSYADVTEGFDYHRAMNVVAYAQEMFMSLPASIRSKFSNDPGAFLEFAQNPENLEKMVEMGLAVKRPDAPGPVKVEVVSSPVVPDVKDKDVKPV